jgi:glycosyltransferase involved in cell wall biosynthesis
MSSLAGAPLTGSRERPHVVIASRIFLPEPAAASFRLAALATALRDAGAAVTVLTVNTPGEGTTRLEGVDIRTFPVKRDAAGYVRGYAAYASFDVPLALRLLAVRSPDIVLAEPPPTTGAVVRAASRLRRIPYAYYAADIWSDAVASTGAPAAVQRALRRTEHHAIASAAVVLSVSDGVTKRLAALGLGDRAITVGNGIDLQSFSIDGPQPTMPGPYFVYAGTASEFQGAVIFLEAFQRVLSIRPDSRLVFLGQGSDYAAIHRAAAALPTGRVIVEGRKPAEVAAQWLRGAAASLVSIRPGVGYDFARPTKLYASAACGTPVIFAGPRPIREFVADHGLGWEVGYDPADVAAAMESALSADPSRPQRQALASWAEENGSLQAASRRAATAILTAAQRR